MTNNIATYYSSVSIDLPWWMYTGSLVTNNAKLQQYRTVQYITEVGCNTVLLGTGRKQSPQQLWIPNLQGDQSSSWFCCFDLS